MILASLSTKPSLMKVGWMAACCTTWQWWVLKTAPKDWTKTALVIIYWMVKKNLACPSRMTCFPWKWEVSCTISASREQSKSFDSTTLSPTACVVGHPTRCNQLGTIVALHFKNSCVIYCPRLFCAPTEQHFPSRDLPVDQPQGNGVASICGPCRIRTQP